MNDSTLAQNLALIRTLKEANPFITHINMRRTDGSSVDIPYSQADFTIRNHRDWIVIDAGISGAPTASTIPNPWHSTGLSSSGRGEVLEPTPTPSSGNPIALPPKPSEEENEFHRLQDIPVHVVGIKKEAKKPVAKKRTGK